MTAIPAPPHLAAPAPISEPSQPRAQGAVRLRCKLQDRASVIDRLYQQGSLKLLFPKTSGPDLTAVLLNTAGGITSGDRFDQRITAAPGTAISLTTQAAERAYCARDTAGRVRTGLRVEEDARLDWLPQETLLFDGAALDRSLTVDLAATAQCLLVESLVFGRRAMGEVLRDISLHDRITVRREGDLIFADRTAIDGDAHAQLQRSATGAKAGALASVVFAAPDAAGLVEKARAVLGETATAGLSAPRPDLIFARLLAEDGFALRALLIPLLSVVRPSPLPRPWML